MKTKIITLAVMMITALGFAQISGTKHDFSAQLWNINNGGTGSGQICNACHTPHGAKAAAAPLWDRVAGTGTFTAYSSTTFNADDANTTATAAVAYSTTPTGVSALCLSCHDGSKPLDNGGAITTTINPLAVRDGGVDEHPISIAYTTQLVAADKGLKSVAIVDGLGLLFSGSIECSSCHDVHNAANINSGTGLLSVTNDGSQLCLSCHAK
ncbi:MAG: cytochrome c3 family protein [Flavobacteriaceae bacterium]|nr:cytochrome c3 family protein [Flavobacteriaceae bacterium]